MPRGNDPLLLPLGGHSDRTFDGCHDNVSQRLPRDQDRFAKPMFTGVDLIESQESKSETNLN
jgi:hypothetical protein